MPSRFPISPGAGLCKLCCDETNASHTENGLCTPKGKSVINRYACNLSGKSSWAKNVSFFEDGDSRSGIAIHSGKNGDVPPFPASHGCVRTSNEGSAIVLDNSSNGKGGKTPTVVQVGGTWAGNRCYQSLASKKRRTCKKTERCGSSTVKPGEKRAETDMNDTTDAEVVALGPQPSDLAGPA